MRGTAALDKLTATVRTEFFRQLADLEADFVASQRTVRQTLSTRTAAAGETTIYLELESMARHVIPLLHRAARARDLSPEGQLARVRQQAAAARLSAPLADNLFVLVREVGDYLTGVTVELLDLLADREIGAVLLDLWHTGRQQFDPDVPGNDTDYNSDDGTPNHCETPRDHLKDLVADAVVTRIMKRGGDEILLAWADALSLARS